MSLSDMSAQTQGIKATLQHLEKEQYYLAESMRLHFLSSISFNSTKTEIPL